MEKREILYLLLLMVLFHSLLPRIAAATSSNISISSQGSITYNIVYNLAPIPEGWNLNGYRGYDPTIPQYAFVDYTVTHNGHPSIRLDQGGMEDPYYPPLIDRAIWLKQRWPARAGDHVVFKIWIKMPSNPRYPNDWTQGGRAGIDGYRNGQNIAPDWLGDEVWVTPHVKWGTDWTQVVLDFVIPSNYTLDHILPWIQVRPGEDPLSGYFSDCEFYINP